jgi:signal transduction histidine kinase
VIPAEDRERVFERFVRLDESRSSDGGGSGLGLPIARTTVAAHGGQLTVEDAPDGWCRLALRLPAAEEASLHP